MLFDIFDTSFDTCLLISDIDDFLNKDFEDLDQFDMEWDNYLNDDKPIIVTSSSYRSSEPNIREPSNIDNSVKLEQSKRRSAADIASLKDEWYVHALVQYSYSKMT